MAKSRLGNVSVSKLFFLYLSCSLKAVSSLFFVFFSNVHSSIPFTSYIFPSFLFSFLLSFPCCLYFCALFFPFLYPFHLPYLCPFFLRPSFNNSFFVSFFSLKIPLCCVLSGLPPSFLIHFLSFSPFDSPSS